MIDNASSCIEHPKTKPFEFQNWPVYEKALEFVVNAYKFCEELPKEPAAGLRDQLRRASQSIPLNIAEGSSRYHLKDKVNFWRVAKGSIFECVAVLDLARRLGLPTADIGHLYRDLETMGRMLSGLIRYLEKGKNGRLG